MTARQPMPDRKSCLEAPVCRVRLGVLRIGGKRSEVRVVPAGPRARPG